MRNFDRGLMYSLRQCKMYPETSEWPLSGRGRKLPNGGTCEGRVPAEWMVDTAVLVTLEKYRDLSASSLFITMTSFAV